MNINNTKTDTKFTEITAAATLHNSPDSNYALLLKHWEESKEIKPPTKSHAIINKSMMMLRIVIIVSPNVFSLKLVNKNPDDKISAKAPINVMIIHI